MREPVNIVCLKHGDNIYDWTWVHKLYNGVKRSFSLPLNFYVFTDCIDTTQPYKQIQLPHIEGLSEYQRGHCAWWYKLYLFAKDNTLTGKIIYFDLDVMLTGNCDFLADVPNDKFGIRKEWYKITSRQIYNSSVMVFCGGRYSYLWELYMQRRRYAQPRLHGDQDFISIHVNKKSLVTLDENKVVSWKYQVYNGGVSDIQTKSFQCGVNRGKYLEGLTYKTPGTHTLPIDARVVVFNGFKNKPNLFQGEKLIEEFWV